MNLASLPGVGEILLRRIRAKYGSDAEDVVSKTPYRLIRDIDHIGFRTADEIALAVGTPKTSPARIEAALRHAVSLSRDNGHTWTSYVDLVDATIHVTSITRDVIEVELDRLLASPSGLAGLWLNEETLAVTTPRVLSQEREVGFVLSAAGKAENVHARDLDDCAPDPSLNAAQRHAFEIAMTHQLSVIAGQAGTGKTFTMAAIARAYESVGLRVALAAPTGKAAARMRAIDSSRRDAKTLHRLLGYNGKKFARDRDWEGEDLENAGLYLDDTDRVRVNADALLVDETSMMDLELTSELLKHLHSSTALVLFGDPHQLQSVGAGAILRDLIDRHICPVTTLTHVVRQAGILRQRSAKILTAGIVDPSARESADPSSWGWIVSRKLASTETLSAIVSLFAPGKTEGVFGVSRGDVQILSPSYKGTAGVDRINLEIQRVLQAERGTEAAPGELYPGDRVIHVKNDYAIDVMNGAIGRVVELGPGARVKVDFEGKIASAAKGNLKLAYAITIHKAQGSEFQCVVTAIDKSHSFMLNRSLLYTAVTRASKVSVLIGHAEAIDRAARIKVDDKRRTLLGRLKHG